MQDAYVFDMGGVIKESFDLEKFYSKIDSKKAFNDFKKYWDENILIAEIGNISSEEFLHRILEYSLSSKDIAEAQKIYGECTGNLYNDAKNVLYSIKEKNKKIYLLSNLKEIDFEFFKKKIDINIFEDLFLSYKLGCMKNDIKIFEILVDKLNIKPENIYFFDDKKENIFNANKVGINAYLVDGMNIKLKIEELKEKGIVNI